MKIKIFDLVNTAFQNSTTEVSYCKVDLNEGKGTFINVVDEGSQYRPIGESGQFEKTESVSIEISTHVVNDYQKILDDISDYVIRLVATDYSIHQLLNSTPEIDVSPADIDSIGEVNRASSEVRFMYKTCIELHPILEDELTKLHIDVDVTEIDKSPVTTLDFDIT